jgi:hypothetical protein
MLESQKRGFSMVNDCILKGDTYKFVMFVRPDILIHNDLPLTSILSNPDKFHVGNHSHFEGLNDQGAIMSCDYARIYGNRIDELADFRKNHGRIVAEKYCLFICRKYNMLINMINFNWNIIRPTQTPS